MELPKCSYITCRKMTCNVKLIPPFSSSESNYINSVDTMDSNIVAVACSPWLYPVVEQNVNM